MSQRTGFSSFTEKQLSGLFLEYHKAATDASADGTDNIELEIRFRNITRDAFETLYSAILADKEFTNPVLECSVNIISENVYERSRNKTKYIRRMVFKGSSVISDTYMQKIRLARPVQVDDYIKYSIGLSRESPSKKFSTSTDAVVRFKVRVSFDYLPPVGGAPKWRFDLTAVKHGALNEIGASLKSIKNDLFVDALSPATLLRELNFDVVDSFEVEIEHIDKMHTVTIDDLAVVKKVFSLINPQYIHEVAYQEEIYHVAKYIVTNQNVLPMFKQSSHRLKQLSNQVIALSKNTYYSDIYPPDGYYLTDKADGVRAVVSINGNRCRVLKSDTMLEFTIGDGTAGPITIADAEMVASGTPGGDFVLYVFDVMVTENKNISTQGFTERSKYLSDVAARITPYLKGGEAKAKNYIRLDEKNLETGFREVWENNFPYTVDGLILTEPNEPYASTRNYKWKPYNRNTIDFLAMRCPQKMLGVMPYEVKKDKDLYLLFVGITQQMREKLGIGFIPHYRHIFPITDVSYYPIQFSPSAQPLAYLYYHPKNQDIDKQIIELGRSEDNTQWVFHHIRTDRKMEKSYFGNDFRTAELTFLNYIDPFNFEDLWQASSSYFSKDVADIHIAPNKFKRFVISVLLNDNLRGAKWVIDEAAGRGADLHRYQEIGVENALFIDIDATAIAELIRRKFSFFANKKRHMRSWFKGKSGGAEKVVTNYDRVHDMEYDKLIIKDVKSLTVHTLVADLKMPHQDLVANTFQFGLNPGMVDGVVCNFALHYLCDTIEHLRNILRFNARMLRVGGLFIFTVMDGEAVFELLKPLETGQKWESRENGILKYAIRKLYAGDKMSSCGQMISVLLPFNTDLVDEPLCNIDTVIAEGHKLGFELELNSPMISYIDKFAKADRLLYDRLTDEDKKYIELFRFVSLRLVKPLKSSD